MTKRRKVTNERIVDLIEVIHSRGFRCVTVHCCSGAYEAVAMGDDGGVVAKGDTLAKALLALRQGALETSVAELN